jgi:glycosyltransferase involved in cell wall biosynthesis
MGLPPKYAEGIEVFMVGRTLDNEESREFYRTLVKTLKSNERIHLLGQIPHENVVEIVAKADLFVCSSRDEVFPLTILEAMSVGKPILSTDVGGVSEMIRNKEEGLIVPKEDSKALAEKIMYLYDHRQELKRLGENAKERFYADFTMERFGGNLLALIKRRIENVESNI